MASLSSLSNELKLAIIDLLDVKAVLKLRLVSRLWVDLCSHEQMFKEGFSIRPHRDDVTRLFLLVENRALAQSIRKVCIYIGDLNDETFRASQVVIDGGNAVSAAERRTLHYLRPQIRKDFLGKIQDFSLAIALQKLPNLTSLVITSMDYPFQGLGLRRIWDEWRVAERHMDETDTDRDRDLASSRWTLLLMSILLAQLPLRKLVLDSIFIGTQMFRVIERFPEQIWWTSTKCVEDLKIGYTGSFAHFYINNSTAQHMGEFVGTMRGLRSLDFTLRMEGIHNQGFYTEFQNSFYRNDWPYLESLRLKYTESPPDLLLPFLTRHASSLRRLHLGESSIDRRDLNNLAYGNFSDLNQLEIEWQALLSAFRDNLALTHFELTLMGYSERIYDDSWNEIPGTEASETKVLERYVLGEGPWPMDSSKPEVDLRCEHLEWEFLAPGEESRQYRRRMARDEYKDPDTASDDGVERLANDVSDLMREPSEVVDPWWL